MEITELKLHPRSVAWGEAPGLSSLSFLIYERAQINPLSAGLLQGYSEMHKDHGIQTSQHPSMKCGPIQWQALGKN